MSLHCSSQIQTILIIIKLKFCLIMFEKLLYQFMDHIPLLMFVILSNRHLIF